MPEIRHGEPTSETVTSARHDTGAGAVGLLLERLRRGPVWSDGRPLGDCVLGEINGATMREAADLIARLTNPAAPSEAMIEAGAKAWLDLESLDPRKSARAVYIAMERERLAMTKGGGE